jgi:hypothetical protein
MLNPYPPGGGARSLHPRASEPDIEFCSDVTAKARTISFWETFAGWSTAALSAAAFTDGTGILPLHTPGETTREKMEAAGLVGGAALSAVVSYMLFSRAKAAGALAQSTEQALADLQDPDAGSDGSDDGGEGESGGAGSGSAGSGSDGASSGSGSDGPGNAQNGADVMSPEMATTGGASTRPETYNGRGKHGKAWRAKAWRVVGECNAALAAWDGSRADAAQYAITLLQQQQAQTSQLQGSADAASAQADAATTAANQALQQKAQSDQVAQQASAALRQSAKALTPANVTKVCGDDGKACPDLKNLRPELFKAP